jgi:hypothetical protein
MAVGAIQLVPEVIAHFFSQEIIKEVAKQNAIISQTMEDENHH